MHAKYIALIECRDERLNESDKLTVRNKVCLKFAGSCAVSVYDAWWICSSVVV